MKEKLAERLTQMGRALDQKRNHLVQLTSEVHMLHGQHNELTNLLANYDEWNKVEVKEPELLDKNGEVV